MRKPWVPGYEKLCDQHKNSFRTTIGKKILIGVCWEKGLKENRGASYYRKLFWRNAFMKGSKDMEGNFRSRETF